MDASLTTLHKRQEPDAIRPARLQMNASPAAMHIPVGFCAGAPFARRHFFANQFENARFYWLNVAVNNLRTRVNMLSSSRWRTKSKNLAAANGTKDRMGHATVNQGELF